MVFSRLAVLCVGAFLFTTGLMGVFGLCSFNRALSVGGVGFFWIRNLICFLSMIPSHCCNVFRIVLWSWLVGSLGMVWKLCVGMFTVYLYQNV